MIRYDQYIFSEIENWETSEQDATAQKYIELFAGPTPQLRIFNLARLMWGFFSESRNHLLYCAAIGVAAMILYGIFMKRSLRAAKAVAGSIFTLLLIKMLIHIDICMIVSNAIGNIHIIRPQASGVIPISRIYGIYTLLADLALLLFSSYVLMFNKVQKIRIGRLTLEDVSISWMSFIITVYIASGANLFYDYTRLLVQAGTGFLMTRLILLIVVAQTLVTVLYVVAFATSRYFYPNEYETATPRVRKTRRRRNA